MKSCELTTADHGDGTYTHACVVCKRSWTNTFSAYTSPCHARGPGDRLQDAIIKWVGEGPTRKCGCADRIRKMNRWGVAGCREHLEEIVDWMMEEAGNRGWWRLAAMVPGSRVVIRAMVTAAIDKAATAT